MTIWSPIAAGLCFCALVLACGGASQPALSPHAGGEQDADADSEADAADAGGADADADGDADADAGLDASDAAPIASGPCPADMVSIDRGFCIDRYEAYVVEEVEGQEATWPHYLPVDGHTVKARNERLATPQSYVSGLDAEEACSNAGKRLCTAHEWKTACMGHARTAYPYGAKREVGTCNDNGKSAVGAVFPTLLAAATKGQAPQSSGTSASKTSKSGSSGKSSTKSGKAGASKKGGKGKGGKESKAGSGKGAPTKGNKAGSGKGTASKGNKKPRGAPSGVDMTVWTKLNDPALGQVEGTVSPSGSREQCVSDYGVYDMVGNRHEWVSDTTPAGHGVFLGGYFSDVEQNGQGCNYRTDAHAKGYHDYSTGFRCCQDVQAD
jgi:formylglycine-generating enzyme required for sulfatase activity